MTVDEKEIWLELIKILESEMRMTRDKLDPYTERSEYMGGVTHGIGDALGILRSMKEKINRGSRPTLY